MRKNVISFTEKKREREEKQEILKNTLRKRHRIILTMDEAYIVKDCVTEAIKRETPANEIPTHKEEVGNKKKLLRKLKSIEESLILAIAKTAKSNANYDNSNIILNYTYSKIEPLTIAIERLLPADQAVVGKMSFESKVYINTLADIYRKVKPIELDIQRIINPQYVAFLEDMNVKHPFLD